jgi:hypothetical protein
MFRLSKHLVVPYLALALLLAISWACAGTGTSEPAQPPTVAQRVETQATDTPTPTPASEPTQSSGVGPRVNPSARGTSPSEPTQSSTVVRRVNPSARGTSPSEPTQSSTVVRRVNPSARGTSPGVSPEVEACLDNVPVYTNAQEDLIARQASARVYVTQDSTEQVMTFYRANLSDLDCTSTMMRVPGFYITCKKDTFGIRIKISAPDDGSPGTAISIECTLQE